MIREEWITSIEDFVDEEDEQSLLATTVSFSQYRIESLKGIDLFQHLVSINLNQNSIEDISALSACATTIEVIHLAYNVISSLKDRAFWSQFIVLKALDLDSNHIMSWKAFLPLDMIPSLICLNIRDNPVTEYSNMRHFVVNHIINLRILNNFVVSDEERIQKSLAFGKHYAALSPNLHIEAIPDQESTISLANHFSNIRHFHEKRSPVILMQKVIRGWYSRKFEKRNLSIYRLSTLLIQSRFRGFLFRQRLKAELRDMLNEIGHIELLKTVEERRLDTHAGTIQRWWRQIDLSITKASAAKRVQRWFRASRCQLEESRRYYEKIGCSHILFLKHDMERLIESAADALRIDVALQHLSNEDARAFVTKRIFESEYTVIKQFTHLRYESQYEAESFDSDGIVRQFHSNNGIAVQCLQNQIELVNRELEKLRQLAAELAVTAKIEIKENNLKKKIEYLELQKQKTIKLKTSNNYAPSVFQQNAVDSIKRRGYKPSRKEKNIRHLEKRYNQLWMYVPGNSTILSRTLHFLGRWAPSFSRPLVYFEFQVIRLNSTVLIQSVWRAYMTRCTMKKILCHRVIKKRAITCIQRAWRFYSGFGRRMRLVYRMIEVLTMTTSRSFFIEAHLYRALLNPTRFRESMKRDIYCSNLHTQIDFNGESVYMVNEPSTTSRCKGIPNWLPYRPVLGPRKSRSTGAAHDKIKDLVSVGVYVSNVYDNEILSDDVLCTSINHEKLQTYSPYKYRKDGFKNSMAYIESLWDASMSWESVCPLVRLTFSSLNEARRRALLLLCLTWDYRYDIYLKVFSFLELHCHWAKRMGQADIPSMIISTIPTRMCNMILAKPKAPLVNAKDTSLQIRAPSYVVVNQDHLNEAKYENAQSIRDNSRRLEETQLENKVAFRAQKVEKIHAKRKPIRPASPFTKSTSEPSHLSQKNRHAAMLKKMRLADEARKEQCMKIYQERKNASKALKIEREIVKVERLAQTVCDKHELKGKVERFNLAQNLQLLEKRQRIENEKDAREKRAKERNFGVAFGNQTLILSRHTAIGQNYKKKYQDRCAYLAEVNARKTQAANQKKIREILGEQQMMDKQIRALAHRQDIRQDLRQLEEQKVIRFTNVQRKKERDRAIKETLASMRQSAVKL